MTTNAQQLDSVQEPIQRVGENAPVPKNLEDLYEVLQMYNQVTQRLQVSHERLQEEVIRLREQLEQKNRELEHKKRLAALGEMAAGIAHEIRNPLGGIQLYASTLAGEVVDRPMAADLVKKISNGVKGLNSLVCDMLAFTGNMNLNRREEDLAEIVAGAVELAAPMLLQHKIEAEIGEGIENVAVNADGKLLQRVLLNLVLNAADAIGDAGIKSGKIRISLERLPEGRIALLIDDNGPGIPEDVLERIFNPFFTTKHSGTGLGLAIVHRIIEAHGGQITAENRAAPDRGARFRIVL
ncbi:MAG TPA: ATP-binding protein [Phycisphaerae bacterium]|nr:ATP-binding protein [Phycisphaerae bacterium]